MASTKCVLILITILAITCNVLGTIDDTYRSLLDHNYPYTRERLVNKDKVRTLNDFAFNNEVQLPRLLVLPPCLCHTKRNSELINSLLGLPKNMNNAGK